MHDRNSWLSKMWSSPGTLNLEQFSACLRPWLLLDPKLLDGSGVLEPGGVAHLLADQKNNFALLVQLDRGLDDRLAGLLVGALAIHHVVLDLAELAGPGVKE